MVQTSEQQSSQHRIPRMDLPNFEAASYVDTGAEALKEVGGFFNRVTQGIATAASFTAGGIKNREQFKRDLGAYSQALQAHCKTEAEFGIEFIRRSVINRTLEAQTELSLGENIKLGVVNKIEESPVNTAGKSLMNSLYKTELTQIRNSTEAQITHLDARYRTGDISRNEYMQERLQVQELFGASIAKLQGDVESLVELVATDLVTAKAKHNLVSRRLPPEQREDFSFEELDVSKNIEKHWKKLKSTTDTNDIPAWAQPKEVTIPVVTAPLEEVADQPIPLPNGSTLAGFDHQGPDAGNTNGNGKRNKNASAQNARGIRKSSSK